MTAAAPGEDPDLAEVIARLRRAMRRAGRARGPARTLPVAQLEMLACIDENPGARPGLIARVLNLAPSSVATLVTTLDAAGLVVREADPADRRAVTLRLTAAGQAAVSTWRAGNAEVVRAALDGLPAGQRDAIVAALPALHGLVRAINDQADELSD
jgi:DNA-binding MarR family transcriptional regulator